MEQVVIQDFLTQLVKVARTLKNPIVKMMRPEVSKMNKGLSDNSNSSDSLFQDKSVCSVKQ